jgi:hypothetical protein
VGATIDLGLNRAPPAPLSSPWPPDWWPGTRRVALSAALLVGLVGGFAPAAPAAPSPLMVVAERTAFGEDFVILGDVLFISGSPRGAAGEPVWSGHQLPTGDYLWTTPDRPAVVTGDGGPVWTVRHHPQDGPQWIARDPETGAELWSTGQPVDSVPGTGVGLLHEDPWLERGSGDQIMNTWHRRLSVVEQATGASLWSVESDAGWRAVAGADGVLLIDHAGRAEFRDLLTGGVRVTRPVPELVPAMLISVRDGTVLAVNLHSPEPELSAYHVETLDRAWQLVAWPRDASGTLRLGGGLDFLFWHTESETGVVDTQTGGVLTLPEPRTGSPLAVGESFVLTQGTERLPREVIHRTTGEVTVDLQGWTLVQPSNPAPRRLLLLRQVAGGTLVASLDGVNGQVHYLGVEPRRLTDCSSFDGGLVCRYGGRIGVWRWR